MATAIEYDTDKFPPPPPETPRDRKARMIALFVMPFLIVTMMYATYMATMHSPKPADVPVAVIGQGAEATTFAADLEDNAAGALDVRTLDSVAEAEELIEQREIAGALQLPGDNGTATVFRATAGGASQAGIVEQALTPAAMAQGWDVEQVDLHPLKDGDGTGTMVLFAAMGMMLAGYVPLSGLLMGAPNLLRVRKFVPLAIGWGAFTSSLIWLILGPIVGAVEGHFGLFLGVGTLAVTAVGVAQLLLTKIMGPFAVLSGMLLWVIFGVPASNLAMSKYSMPGFFEWLNGVLPMPAAGGALRSVIYFDGVGLWDHLRVLVLWIAITLLLAVLKERKAGDLIVGGPLYTAPDAPLPALSGGPIAPYRKRLMAVALFPLSIVLTVVTLMSLSMSEAKVSQMPVAVVGPQPAAQQFIDSVEPQIGEYVDLQVAETTEEAAELIIDQDAVAAYELPSSADEPATLLTASGANLSQVAVVSQIFAPIAAESGAGLNAEDIAPLTDDDTGGSNSMYVGMAWIMAAFLFFAVMRGGAPDLTRTRQLMPLVAGWSVGIAIWFWFMFDVLIGAVNGHALELIGYGAFTIFALSWPSAVLIRMFGLGAIVPVMIIVMLAGVPASGGGLSVYMIPEFLRPLADILPLPAAVDIARSVVYLDGSGVGSSVLLIAIWGVVGLALNFLVVDRWTNRAAALPPAPMGPRYEPERKPKKSATSDEDAAEAVVAS